MTKPLRVLYSIQHSGIASKWLRVLEPLRRLQLAGLVEPVCLEELLQREGGDALTRAGRLVDFDVLFLFIADLNTQSSAWLGPVVAAARAQQVAVLCDTDDPYFIPADGVTLDEGLAPHLDAMKRLLLSANLLTVTTPTLKAELATLGVPIAVMPNLVDLDTLPRRPAKGARVRVGWSGGPTHVDDLAAFLPAMERLQRLAPVDFVLLGMFDRNIDETVARARKTSRAERAKNPQVAAFGRMADALKGVTYQHFPSVPFAQFPARLAELDLDIGVCPVLDTAFNRCRSGVKFYQYAGADTVTVASDVPCYRGECSLLVQNTPEAWVQQLEPLVRDAALRSQVLEAQRAWVQQHRTWTVGVPLYANLFTAVRRAVKGA